MWDYILWLELSQYILVLSFVFCRISLSTKLFVFLCVALRCCVASFTYATRQRPWHNTVLLWCCRFVAQTQYTLTILLHIHIGATSYWNIFTHQTYTSNSKMERKQSKFDSKPHFSRICIVAPLSYILV